LRAGESPVAWEGSVFPAFNIVSLEEAVILLSSNMVSTSNQINFFGSQTIGYRFSPAFEASFGVITIWTFQERAYVILMAKLAEGDSSRRTATKYEMVST
jgi:uncharacterized Rmd1/YagE family protein